MSSIFVKGVVIGFSIAATVGPICMLCIRNAIAYGLLPGLATGLGAAFADACFGILARLGIGIITTFIMQNSIFLHICGAVFLWYIGLKTFNTLPAVATIASEKKNLLHFSVTTFFLTLTNPITVIMFAGIYAGLRIGSPGEGIVSILLLTFGIFLGSLTWWIILSFVFSYIGQQIDQKKVVLINKASGMILILCASYSTYAALKILFFTQ